MMRLKPEQAGKVMATTKGTQLRIRIAQAPVGKREVFEAEQRAAELFADEACCEGGDPGGEYQGYTDYMVDLFLEAADLAQWREPVTRPDEFVGNFHDAIVQQLVDYATDQDFWELHEWLDAEREAAEEMRAERIAEDRMGL